MPAKLITNPYRYDGAHADSRRLTDNVRSLGPSSKPPSCYCKAAATTTMPYLLSWTLSSELGCSANLPVTP